MAYYLSYTAHVSAKSIYRGTSIGINIQNISQGSPWKAGEKVPAENTKNTTSAQRWGSTNICQIKTYFSPLIHKMLNIKSGLAKKVDEK